MTLAGDVVSHVALPGLGIAFLLGIDPLLGAAAALAAGVLLIDQLQRSRGLSADAAVGVVYVAALAGGMLLTPREDLMEALFGGFGAVTATGFVLGLLGCAVASAVTFALRDRLTLTLFSPDMARSLDVNVDRVNLAYLGAFALTILLGLRFLGALLVGALIIVPAASGRRVAQTLEQFLVVSAAAGALSFAIGFAAAARFQVALGPAIAAVASIIFAASLLWRRASSVDLHGSAR
jgi:zinc transport system permease protein